MCKGLRSLYAYCSIEEQPCCCMTCTSSFRRFPTSTLGKMRIYPVAALSIVSLSALSDGFILPRAPPARDCKSSRLLRQTKTRIQQAQGSGDQPMSYADRLRQARAAKQAGEPGNRITPTTPPTAAARVQNEPGEAEPESPFSPQVFEELRTVITLLAARLQREGPMSRSEFERFEHAVAVVVDDAIPREESLTPPQTSMPATPELDSSTDEFESEGPGWDPKAKSYGLPKGTTNTYTIDGMGAMQPDEYQQALRERVISRARSARETGAYGNIVSNNYLNFLSKNPKGEDALSEEQGTIKDHEDFEGYK